MDFGALPPEINSARMYAGAGAAPLMAAAASWHAIAAELSTTAASFESVITQLATEQWMGPASLAMAAAAQPFLAWLTYTAESTALAGSQATASAAAFETAFAMTVPPAEVAANRALLAALVATNILGQNTPAIAATEAHYAEMWAQDALAMYGYAAASAAAGRLNPLTPPAQIANPAGVANQAAAVGSVAAANSVQQAGLGNLISNVPNAVMAFATPVASTAEATALDTVAQQISALLETPFVMNTVNGVVNTVGWFTMAGITTAVFLGHTLNATAPAAGAVSGAAGVAALANTTTPVLAGAVPALAGLGQAATVGGLSVPASWSTAAPAMTTGTTVLEGTGWAVPQESGAVLAMPGAPGIAGSRDGFAGPPRYGFKPVVMPNQRVV
ncbi:PPE family protein [Mycobacterium bourgelatii]|uniref:PPE family protein PPE43 n=1 Tax=Mycobacterium bourgelatii TaxID=1273442 RepID=A0A7I9YMC1_MYCBU|nr:PPE family protein [Mycobacterium bourgelatii]MCV6977703.1 PPE family protein [Mycobacterium bourgelatii]GFG89824.1 PPE family protein PPE43 [Mycobacterium bourgelatii]